MGKLTSLASLINRRFQNIPFRIRGANSAAVISLTAMLLLTGCMNDIPPLNIDEGYLPPATEPTTVQTEPPIQTELTTSQTEPPTIVTEPTDVVYQDPDTGISYDHYEVEGEISERFELPLEGATGFAPIPIAVKEEALTDSADIAELAPGDAFVILEEKDGSWWYITQDGSWSGWVENVYCYLNIPDVVPSIVFDNTNAYSSVFVSSGKDIPGITGEQLYESKRWNERLGEDQFIMAANYEMVKRIYEIQQAALADGYTLVIYETFRPHDVQLDVAARLKDFSYQDSEVKAGINAYPWDISWFIASGLSTHQVGCAMDVSLAKVERMEVRLSGRYQYAVTTEFTLCDMPTAIHELSAAAVSLAKPVSSTSKTAWKSVQPAETMTEDALRLRDYCTNGGLYPLASEWWHFNDLDAKEAIGNNYIEEAFHLNDCMSRIPE